MSINYNDTKLPEASLIVNNALISTNNGITRTLSNKFNDVVNVKDFGAVGDGTADDTLAFEAMVSHCSMTGSTGLLPAGTYLVSFSNRVFSSNKPFCLRGDGRRSTILKNLNTTGNFIYWRGCNGVGLEGMTIDGSFVGSPTEPTSGGTVVFVDSSDNYLDDIDFKNIWRIAYLAFNDHQTTTENVYGNHRIRRVSVFGPENYINNVGPSAFILADQDNSVIEDCYIENIGLYGYEFKNDSNNAQIKNCVAAKTYYPVYFGGDGARLDLGYVKSTAVSGVTMHDCVNPISIGRGSYNTISSCLSVTSASGPTPVRAVVAISSYSEGNRVSNLHVIGRKGHVVDIRDESHGNSVEFSLSDTDYTGETIRIISADSLENSVVITWKNHNNSVANPLRFVGPVKVQDVKAKYNYSATSEANPRFTDALVGGSTNIPPTAKGRVQYGNTFDTHTATLDGRVLNTFGSFENYNAFSEDYRLSAMEKQTRLVDPVTSVATTFIHRLTGFSPSSSNDGGLNLGAPTARWAQVYAATGAISTSDERSKQQIKPIDEAVLRAWARVEYMQYKFNDSVEEKDVGARWHFGLIAQRVKEAFETEGLDAFEYGLLCYDKWEDEWSDVEVVDQAEVINNDTGEIEQERKTHVERKLTIAAGERYGIRYEEALCLEAAYQRRRAARMEARIAALEAAIKPEV